MINAEDHAVLAQQDMKTLAEWWCLLNRWEWPRELVDPEPAVHVPGGRRGRIMDWIDQRIGHRVVSREWNRHMTDEEHEDFWRGVYEGNAEALARHRKRTADRISAGKTYGR